MLGPANTVKQKEAMIKLDASVHLCIESISEILLKSHLNIRQANNYTSHHIHRHTMERSVARVLKRGKVLAADIERGRAAMILSWAVLTEG